MRTLSRLALALSLIPLALNGQAVRYNSVSSTTSSQCAPGAMCPLLVIPGSQINFCTGSGLGVANTAGTVVTATSGPSFTGASGPIQIAGSTYQISVVVSSTVLILTTSAGTQTGAVTSTLAGCLANPVTGYTTSSAGTPCPTTAQLTPQTGGACVNTADAQGNFGLWTLAGLYYYYLQTPASAGSQVRGPYPLNIGSSTGCPSNATCDANYATLPLGCTAAGAGTLYGTRAWNGLTTQSFACWITPLASFRVQPASGQTVTIQVSGAALGTICDISQGGHCVITTATGVTYPQYWGALCNNSNDDSASLRESFVGSNNIRIATGSTCLYNNGSGAMSLSGWSGTLSGEGYANSHLWCTAFVNTCTQFAGANGLYIRDVDMRFKLPATALGTATLGSTALTVSSVVGAIATTYIVVGTGILPHTTISSGSGSSWVLSNPTVQALSSTPLSFFSVDRNGAQLLVINTSNNVHLDNLYLHDGTSSALNMNSNTHVFINGLAMANMEANGAFLVNNSDLHGENVSGLNDQDSDWELSQYDGQPGTCGDSTLNGFVSINSFNGYSVNSCTNTSLSNFSIIDANLGGVGVIQDSSTTTTVWPDNVSIGDGVIIGTGYQSPSNSVLYPITLLAMATGGDPNPVHVNISNVIINQQHNGVNTSQVSNCLQLANESLYRVKLSDLTLANCNQGADLDGGKVNATGLTVNLTKGAAVILRNAIDFTGSGIKIFNAELGHGSTRAFLSTSTGPVSVNGLNLVDTQAANSCGMGLTCAGVEDNAASGSHTFLGVNWTTSDGTNPTVQNTGGNVTFYSFSTANTVPSTINLKTVNLTQLNGVFFQCGNTTVCANTAIPLVQVIGEEALVSGSPSTVTVTGLPFTSSATYQCLVTQTATTRGIYITQNSGSSVTFTGANTISDSFNYWCGGS